MSEIGISKCEYYDEEYCITNKHAYVYCCQKGNCYYKQLQQLKQENEELKNCDKTYIYKQARVNFEKQKKYKQCLDEIEDIIEECKANSGCYDTCKYYDLCNCDTGSFVLQLIKQAKEGK